VIAPLAGVHAGHAAHLDARLDQGRAHQYGRVQRVTGRCSANHGAMTTKADLARDQDLDVFAKP
jgi:hypothetical protein